MNAARLRVPLGLLALASVIAFAPPAGAAAKEASPSPAETRSTTAEPVAPAPSRPPGIVSISTGGHPPSVGIGEDVTVPEGETLNSDATCVRGRATIDGTVNGDLVAVAGTVVVHGTINGDVVAVASEVTLHPGATVRGQLVNVGGSLHRAGATIHGQVVNIPLGINLGPWRGWWPTWHGFGFSTFFMWIRLFKLLLFFVCALLLAALVPDRIRLISEETPVRFFAAVIFGLVGYVIYVLVQAFLVLTLIGIPLAVLSYVAFLVLKWMAMCGIFHHVGTKLGRVLGREMSLLGGLLLGFLPFALLRLIPCVGWVIWFFVEIVAVGYLIVTRVGTYRGPVIPPRPAAPPAAPPPPPAPTPTVSG